MLFGWRREMMPLPKPLNMENNMDPVLQDLGNHLDSIDDDERLEHLRQEFVKEEIEHLLNNGAEMMCCFDKHWLSEDLDKKLVEVFKSGDDSKLGDLFRAQIHNYIEKTAEKSSYSYEFDIWMERREDVF